MVDDRIPQVSPRSPAGFLWRLPDLRACIGNWLVGFEFLPQPREHHLVVLDVIGVKAALYQAYSSNELLDVGHLV